jgi:hypothetical protein
VDTVRVTRCVGEKIASIAFVEKIMEKVAQKLGILLYFSKNCPT